VDLGTRDFLKEKVYASSQMEHTIREISKEEKHRIKMGISFYLTELLTEVK
jgi:hypothetical protein